MFLPISEASDIVVPLDDSALGEFRLLLHGYFFLDSGRRQIEGLNAAVETGVPADATALRRVWNAELRDSVVLPLLPTLLRDALGEVLATVSASASIACRISLSEKPANGSRVAGRDLKTSMKFGSALIESIVGRWSWTVWRSRSSELVSDMIVTVCAK